MKKLRLLLFEDCNRNCAGCCNNDWDLKNLEREEDFSKYELIMLTGGEPMIRPQLVKDTIEHILKVSTAKVVVYTAKVDDIETSKSVLNIADGITVTLHEQHDVAHWVEFANSISGDKRYGEKSLRDNIFAGIDAPNIDGWKRKDDITWIKDSPLPTDEVFRRL